MSNQKASSNAERMEQLHAACHASEEKARKQVGEKVQSFIIDSKSFKTEPSSSGFLGEHALGRG